MNESLNKHNFQDVVLYGKFYYPASSHYGSHTTNVVCDRCGKTGLVSSIGYRDNMDLCLNCADIVTIILEDRKKTLIEYDEDRYRPLTLMAQASMRARMAQGMFNPNPGTGYITTNMAQGMFNNKVDK